MALCFRCFIDIFLILRTCMQFFTFKSFICCKYTKIHSLITTFDSCEILYFIRAHFTDIVINVTQIVDDLSVDEIYLIVQF